MATRELRVNIVGDSKDLERALGSASSASSKLGGSLRTLGKVAAVGVGAAFAGFAVILKNGFDELSEGQKVAAQTGAVLKSTGGAANVTAKQVNDLASSLSNMSGVDDEAIGAGENMLLTFTNIRNEVGKGNDIFTQSTKVLLDMSTALGQDMPKSAIQLGKALNDPVKGVSALQRVGVTFSDQQKKTIQGLVESGHAMEAQKIILAELNKEFGGSAKAYGTTLPGQLAKLRNAFDEVSGQVASVFVPILASGASKVAGFLQDFGKAKGFRAKLNVIWEGVRDVAVALWDQLTAAFRAIDWGAVGQTLSAGFSKALAFLGSIDYAGILSGVATRILNAFRTIVRAVDWGALGRDIGNALVLALQQIGAFIRQVDWNQVGQALIEGFKQGLIALGTFLAGVDWMTVLSALFNTLVAVLKGLGSLVLGIMIGVGKALLQGLGNGLDAAWPTIASWFSSLPGKLKNFFANAGQWLYQNSIIPGLLGGIRAGWNAVTSWFGALPGKVKAFFSGAGSWLYNNSIIPGLLRGITAAWDNVKTWFGGLPGKIGGYFKGAVTWLLEAGKDVLQGFLDGLIAKAKDIETWLTSHVKHWIYLATHPWEIGSPSMLMFRAGTAVIQGFTDGIDSKSGSAAKAMKDMVSKAQQAVRDARNGFATAFSELASQALSAFDAAMSAWKPPAQKLLDKRQLDRQRQELKDAIKSTKDELKTASDELTAALMGGDPEKIAAAQAQRLAAQKAYNDALAAQTDFNLQQQAAKQQEAHDKQVARDRIAFANRLAALQNDYLNQEITTKEFHKRLNALMEKYGVDQQFYGTAAGIAFASGITKATNAVVAAFTRLLKRLERLGKLKSNAEEGPLSDIETWWVGMAPALIKGINFGLIRAAGVRIGAEMGLGLKETKVDTSGILASLGILKGTATPAVESLTEVSDSYDTVSESIGTVTQKAAALWQPLIDGAKKAFADLNDPLTGIASLYQLVADAVAAIGAAAYATRDALRDTASEIVLLWRQIAASGAPIPGKALGGPVHAGRSYVVGERGPELFIPSTSGRIVANGNTSMRAAGGTSVIVNVYGDVSGEEIVRKVREGLLRVSLYNPGNPVARTA